MQSISCSEPYICRTPSKCQGKCYICKRSTESFMDKFHLDIKYVNKYKIFKYYRKFILKEHVNYTLYLFEIIQTNTFYPNVLCQIIGSYIVPDNEILESIVDSI